LNIKTGKLTLLFDNKINGTIQTNRGMERVLREWQLKTIKTWDAPGIPKGEWKEYYENGSIDDG